MLRVGGLVSCILVAVDSNFQGWETGDKILLMIIKVIVNARQTELARAGLSFALKVCVSFSR